MWLQAAKVVAVDVVDIVGERNKFCKDLYTLWLGKIHWLSQYYGEITRSLNIYYSTNYLDIQHLIAWKLQKLQI